MIGGFWRKKTQSRRETADRARLAIAGGDRPLGAWQVVGAGGPQPPAYCQDCDPSPCRFDRLAIGPAPLCRSAMMSAGRLRPSSAGCQFPFAMRPRSAEAGRCRINQEKGSIPCSNSVSFSPVRRSRASRPVSTMISNAGSPGPRGARLSSMPSVATLSPARSSAAPAGRFATNSRPLAADLTAPVQGARSFPTAVPGAPRGGGLAFEGP